ncbi:MAG: DUF4124 domain-containing protein [Thermodesulfobacteriota bacterium]
MKKFRAAVMAGMIAGLLLSIPSQSLAEYYRYRDEKGVTRYTDNLADVPVDQREGAKEYEEFVTPPGEKKAVVKPDAKSSGGGATSMEKPTPSDVTSLTARQDSLTAEYSRLMEEKSRLEEERAQITSKAQTEAFNRKANEFNQKISAYEKKRARLEKEIQGMQTQR